MPLFRAANAIHLFAHVPKCGGASVEAYLRDRFGELGFLDTRRYDRPSWAMWTRTSPQHVPTAALARLIPSGWIASSFAIVRHPVDRLVSAYNHCIDPQAVLPAGLSIEEWFEEFLLISRRNPWLYDGHLLPQTDLVPEDATWFRLEAGLEPVVAHLDRLAGDASGPRSIGHSRHSAATTGLRKETRRLSPRLLARIEAHYAADFARFGYAPDADRAFDLLIPQRDPAHDRQFDVPRQVRSLTFRRFWRHRVRALREVLP
jgi:Sulfotransferase family